MTEPQIYDHYQVEKVLGRGAMGVVYLARDLRIGRYVALKTLQEKHQIFDDPEAEADFFTRFRREAELCGSLIHPNIITLYEVGYASKRITYLAMEYIDGESLLSLLRRNGTLDLETSLKITDDILQGLAYAHDRGVIHRDIKPANILVTVEGQAKVSDFGVARSVRASLSLRTQEGQILGTPYYMAPEHIAGRPVDARADLFSVGVVLYEMITGQKPFEGANVMDILYNVVNHPTPDLSIVAPRLPASAAAFIERLLEKTPEARFLSASAAARELRRLLAAHRSVVEPLEMTLSVPVHRASTPEETPTTPITAPSPRLKDRAVSRWAALAVITTLLASLLASMISISNQIDEHPSIFISEKTLDEFETKRSTLREAQILYNAGAYEASRTHFDQYLQRYPWSAAAREGRTQANQAIEAVRARSTPPVKKIAVLPAPPKRNKIRPLPAATQTFSDQVANAEAVADEKADVTIWSRVRRFFWRAFKHPTPKPAPAQTPAPTAAGAP